MIDKDGKDDIEYITNELINCYGTKFYGDLIITFQKGRIVTIKKHIELKPPSFHKKKEKMLANT